MRSRFTIQPSRRSGAPRASGLRPATPTVIPRSCSRPLSASRKHTVLWVSPRRSRSASGSSTSLKSWSQPCSWIAKLALADLHPSTLDRDESQLLELPRVRRGPGVDARDLAAGRGASLAARSSLTLPDERETLSGLPVAVQRETSARPRRRNQSVSEPADILPHASAASTGPTFTPTSVVSPVIEHEAQAHRAVGVPPVSRTPEGFRRKTVARR